MKFSKKKWKNQLDKIVPPLDENIKNMPIKTPSQANANGGNTLTRTKKITAGIACALVAVLIIAIVLACTLPSAFKPTSTDFIFTVEINPSATFTTNENGIVKSVVSSNADADVILSNNNILSQMIGKPIDEAIKTYTDRAGMLGYIDMSKTGSAVRISACEKGEELLQTAQNALQAYFIEKGIFAVVIGETVGLDELCSRSGFVANSINDLSAKIKECETLFSGREAENADKSQLTDLYINNILSSNLVNIVKEYLYENIELIKPFVTDIKTLLDNFSQEILLQYSSLFTNILNLIGLSDSPIFSLVKIPADLQEFLNTLNSALEIEFNSRKAEFESIYNEIRSITSNEYYDFVDGLIAEYGSLENYWHSIK